MSDQSRVRPARAWPNASHDDRLLRQAHKEFVDTVNRIGTSRDLSLAITHAEDALGRALKHLNGGEWG